MPTNPLLPYACRAATTATGRPLFRQFGADTTQPIRAGAHLVAGRHQRPDLAVQVTADEQIDGRFPTVLAIHDVNEDCSSPRRAIAETAAVIGAH